MDKQDDGGPAFPRDHAHDGHNGMSKHEYLTAKAMQGLLSQDQDYWIGHAEKLAEVSMNIATVMLSARARPEAR